MTSQAPANFGVYVHVPFCAHRCDYCAFATYSDRDHLMEDYVTSVIQEIAWARDEGLPTATSVFFGGGTPSRLDADQLLRVLEAVPRTEDAEVTVECNPEDASLERLRAYRAGGVNRMSFGVQSTQPAVLADLGRRHGTMAHEEVARNVTAAGFSTWNMDLIIGSRAESLGDVANTLDDLLGLDSPPPHISCYVLTAEPGTPLGEDPIRHPDEDESADAYELVSRVLEENGYQWEEISNWARPGHECRHNHVYWDQDDYIGFGSAAHSHRHGRRFWNVRTPDRYIAMVREGLRPLGGEESLDERTQRFERDSLALRTAKGVPLEAFESLEEITHLVSVRDGRVTLAPSGRLLANQVILRLGSSN
ncbi:MAG TPA: radical SAM family heme chaperone HemW [Acidimicrobiales bacterium]|nr:radical SAM family heme chaperone HemW [Acidimicrobiales bacterium]